MTATVTGSTFTGNSATDGGGIFNAFPTSNALHQLAGDGDRLHLHRQLRHRWRRHLQRCPLTVNPRLGTLVCRGTVAVSGSTFTGNSASNDGGAIDNFGTAAVTDSTFTDNTAGHNGGGIFNAITVA